MYFVLLVLVLCVFVLCFLCLDIYQLYFNCKFVRLSHSFIKGYLTWLTQLLSLLCNECENFNKKWMTLTEEKLTARCHIHLAGIYPSVHCVRCYPVVGLVDNGLRNAPGPGVMVGCYLEHRSNTGVQRLPEVTVSRLCPVDSESPFNTVFHQDRQSRLRWQKTCLIHLQTWPTGLLLL